MGVEVGTISAGGIGGVTAGIGAAGGGAGVGASLGGIGRGLGEGSIGMGSAISAGPARGFGSLASFGPKLEAPSLPFVNEGPVIGGLEMFKPIGQINFNNQAQTRPQPISIEVPEVFQTGLSDINLDPNIKPSAPKSEDPLSEIATVAGVAQIEAQPTVHLESKIIVSDASRLAAVRETISWLVVPALDPAIKSKSVLATQVATQPQAGIKVASVPAVQAVVVEDQQIEELVEEVVAVKKVKNEKDEIQEERNEAGEEIKIQRVVDESAVKERISEIIAAAVAVQEEEGGVIEGQKIVEKLPSQNKKNRSGELNIVDPEGRLLDGSLLATVKKIASGKFASVLDVIKRAPKIVAEDIPVTRGEGQLVTDKDVAKVYEQYKGKIPPAKEVIRRVVRMLKQIKVVKKSEQPAQNIPIHEEIVEKNEGTLHPELAAALLAPAHI